MNTRLIPAAAQLIEEVANCGRRFKVACGDADGYGFIREITFDGRTSNWLVPILEAIGDQRIRYVNQPHGKGRATIRFVGDTRADHKAPYGIAAVDHVLND